MNQKSRTAWRQFFRMVYPVHPPDRQNSAEYRLKYEYVVVYHIFSLSLFFSIACVHARRTSISPFVSATLQNTLRFQIHRAMSRKISFNGAMRILESLAVRNR